MATFKNGDQVKYKYPERGEEGFIFNIIDDSDQKCLLIQCNNSTLAIACVEDCDSKHLVAVK